MVVKVLVVGGGPGGYVAALRAAQLGAEVTVVEKKALGGTCLNVGCVPTKVLLNTTGLYQAIAGGKRLGLKAEGLTVDWPALQKRRKQIVRRLVTGVGFLLRKANCEVVTGAARLTSKNSIVVTADGNETMELTADKIILATGSEPVQLPLPGLDLPEVIYSDAALALTEIPKSMLIIGGGVIGVELASVYQALGTKCIIVEMLPRILPSMDGELAEGIGKSLSSLKVDIYTSAQVLRCQPAAEGVTVKVRTADGELQFTVNKVLAAVGRRPATSRLGLEEAGIEMDGPRIAVNEYLETSVPGIYAVGDAVGGDMLAHTAYTEGSIAADNALGNKKPMNYTAVPACIYTRPEAASVGLTEKQALEAGHKIKVGRFPLIANSKALIKNVDGFMKVIANDRYGEILGVHILGPDATELISEAALAIRMEATVEELAANIHPHPSVSEALGEAALATDKIALHIPN
ncbi:MAG TPA: dihydrolipoyl dehydrogenase [bacterium]|jgi:dihydrolipoamide dehydrogenase|nr:dihydrolipoyl dehydrogenase [bacterium]